jgi:5-oxoprolinase (ATP-hydrolysing)
VRAREPTAPAYLREHAFKPGSGGGTSSGSRGWDATYEFVDRWQFWIDRGGTFTDCIGLDPSTRKLRVIKVLSSDRAPLEGIRKLLDIAPDASIPACDVRMGTTLATNALLERRGVNTTLTITRGFGDLLRIGDQTRPDLFALDIEQPPELARTVIEHDARRDAAGAELSVAHDDSLLEALVRARAEGSESLAVAVMHDYAEGTLEKSIAELARKAGFEHVVCSHEVSPQLGFLARSETTVVDAYLTPLLKAYLVAMASELPESRLRMMQSSGGLTEAQSFRGRDAVLSGPAGGAVALLELARRTGEREVIGFDMGGTSTDVTRCAGELPRVYETRVSGVRLRAPMMDIHTIAAGGGSLCRFDGHKLTVGPESAGARPGPLCYGHPDARELALTDVHLALGRLVGDRFPFPLDERRVERALAELSARVHPQAGELGALRVAEGFFEIAVESMADAIRRVTIARGHDVRTHALAVFGGAGGQAACAVARRLGIRRLLVHPLAGVLSAYGMGVADDTWHGERDLGGALLTEASVERAQTVFPALESEGARALVSQGNSAQGVRFERRLDLRYAGTETALTLPELPFSELCAAFHALHAQSFGYARPEHPIELVVARLEARVTPALDDVLPTVAPQDGKPVPERISRLYLGGVWLERVPVYDRDKLGTGVRIHGPALVLDATATLVVEPGFVVSLRKDGVLVAEDEAMPMRAQPGLPVPHIERDPVLLEVFNHLFMSVAEQMGVVLKRTALSTNIRERMDFSCAVFDAKSGLVANAPHIPVHLGAMAESVRAVLLAHPVPEPGDVFVTNDPALGGSHLPDVTVVSPVHGPDGTLRYVCASRGHHADIGGITPGSMPPDSTSLVEEGVVLSALRIVHLGALDRELVLRTLRSGPYPARNPLENLADLEAQVAANQAGGKLLRELDERFGHELVAAYMQYIQDNAAESVHAAVAQLSNGEYGFADALDDGTPLCVRVVVKDGHLSIDFTGTGGEHPENLNAPRAVTVAAVLYVLRCLVGKPIPLNSGCLRHVDLHIPSPSLLSPSPTRAVVAGNVETSQRVVDILLGALGVAAASQGTMNNFTFGTGTFGYYETIAGGAGATDRAPGASAVHTHMTNTRITDPEVLERRFPVRLVRFAVRTGSGGNGRHHGGDGVIRELEALEPMTVSFLTERRLREPFGLKGGGPGARGHNFVNDRELSGRAAVEVRAGDRIRIETPGGGGFGAV